MPARQQAGSPMIRSQQTWSPVLERSGFWKGGAKGHRHTLGVGKWIPNLLSHFPRSCEMGKFLFAVELSN